MFITKATLYSFLILQLLVSQVIESMHNVKTLPGFHEDLPFTLETGYIGIGETEEVQLFYYFIESERNPRDDPLMLWISGGPGCSSLTALLFEFGPFTFNYSKSSADIPALELNPFSWTKVANIIFLDQPVGAGFSYAKTSEAYNMNDTLSAKQTYDFLRKWLVNHPNFLHNPLYVGADSYAGLVLPIIVHEIYNGNEVGLEPWMNIKGYMLGNPLADKHIDYNAKLSFSHRMALISDSLYESLNENCGGEYLDVDPNNLFCVDNLREVHKCLDKIRDQMILEPWCAKWNLERNYLAMSTGSLETNSFDILGSLPPQECRSDRYLYSFIWANNIKVQEALHIHKDEDTNNNKQWMRCNESMTYKYGDIKSKSQSYTYNMQSALVYHQNFTNRRCRALIYSGDHDMVVSYVGTMQWVKSLGLPLETDWKPWFVAGQIAGYTMKYSKSDHYTLTYATVKGAGHTAPEYKPEECLAMVSRFSDAISARVTQGRDSLYARAWRGKEAGQRVTRSRSPQGTETGNEFG